MQHAEPAPLSVGGRLLTALITAYRRWVSPFLGPHCRFAPSCSAYALEAVRRYGAVRGSALAVRRLLRCHPFNPGGVDPVPARAAGDAGEVPSRSGEQRC